MRIVKIVKPALVLTLGLAGCLFAEHYNRIVSLGPYVTENICLLGVSDKIIGVTIHELTNRKEGKQIIGTLLQPNIEKIVSLRPDIVIASKEGNRPAAVKKLQSSGIKVLTLEELFSFEDICTNFAQLGKILGKEKEASRIIQREKNNLDKLRKEFRTGKKKKVLFALGLKPIYTVGAKTYISQMIQYAGGENIFGNIRKKYMAVSLEETVKRNPDAILMLEMGQGKKATQFWKRFSHLNAVKNNRIFIIQDTLIGSPTPESFVNAVEIIGKLLE